MDQFLLKFPGAAKYGDLSPEKIEKVKKEFSALFNVELPKDYIEMLHHTNGFSYNGKSIAGVYDDEFLADHPRKKSMDIIRFNSSFRDMTDITDYILLGKSSIDLIVYNISEKAFQILSNGTMQCFGTFDSFSELLCDYFGSD